jgi:hypothetical protein
MSTLEKRIDKRSVVSMTQYSAGGLFMACDGHGEIGVLVHTCGVDSEFQALLVIIDVA